MSIGQTVSVILPKSVRKKLSVRRNLIHSNEEIFHPITKSTLESLLDQRKYDEFIRETGIVAKWPFNWWNHPTS
jgi:hypothetical protein